LFVVSAESEEGEEGAVVRARKREDCEVAGKLILVLGGVRSGKSTFAQELASGMGGEVCFLATAEAGDGEMEERIRRHRGDRPVNWKTLELAGGVRLESRPGGGHLVLMDCFTVYLSNLMALRGLDWPPEEEDLMPEGEVARRSREVEGEALALVDSLRGEARALIVVSNEVGMGVVPPYRLGRIFRDLAGRLNQRLAERADEVYLVAAGLPLRLK